MLFVGRRVGQWAGRLCGSGSGRAAVDSSPADVACAIAAVTLPQCDSAGATSMGNIDRQRIEAVRTLERFGYTFTGTEWVAPAETAQGTPPALTANADAMHALLVLRADKLAGCTEGSVEEGELPLIADTLEHYEAVRWPDGKEPQGKG